MNSSSNRQRSPMKSGTWCISIDPRGHSTWKSGHSAKLGNARPPEGSPAEAAKAGAAKAGHFAKPGDDRTLEDASMSELRIFSYLPNPRIWKATIAARLPGVEVEVRGT